MSTKTSTRKRTDERNRYLADVLIGAVEGGTGYWAQVSGYRWSDEHPETTRVTLHEFGDADEITATHEIDLDVIARGIQRIVEGGLVAERIRNEVTCDSRDNEMNLGDSDTCDCIMQAALFGEIVYG